MSRYMVGIPPYSAQKSTTGFSIHAGALLPVRLSQPLDINALSQQIAPINPDSSESPVGNDVGWQSIDSLKSFDTQNGMAEKPTQLAQPGPVGDEKAGPTEPSF